MPRKPEYLIAAEILKIQAQITKWIKNILIKNNKFPKGCFEEKTVVDLGLNRSFFFIKIKHKMNKYTK